MCAVMQPCRWTEDGAAPIDRMVLRVSLATPFNGRFEVDDFSSHSLFALLALLALLPSPRGLRCQACGEQPIQ